MSKAVVFKQPTIRPTADDWVEKRVKEPVAPVQTPTVLPEPAALPQLAAETTAALEATVGAAPVPVELPPAHVVSAETVALPTVPAPRVLLERATTRMSVSIDETIHMRLKILCARGRFKIGEFMSKAIEEAVVKAEQEAVA